MPTAATPLKKAVKTASTSDRLPTAHVLTRLRHLPVLLPPLSFSGRGACTATFDSDKRGEEGPRGGPPLSCCRRSGGASPPRLP
jgi:hypothetical protein